MSTKSTERDGGPSYVYIAGRGHSGSTLLTLLLARHPRVAAIGELANLSLQLARDEKTRWVGRCSCGERPPQCPVWGGILREIGEEEGVDLENKPFSWKISDIGFEEEYRQSAPFRVPIVWGRNRIWRMIRYAQYLLPKYLSVFFSLYRPQQVWGKNRSKLASKFATACDVDAIIDASKDPLDMLDVYTSATLPVKIVFLTRDCRGNVWSMLKRLASGQQRHVRTVSAAKEWSRVNSRIWRLVQNVPRADWVHLRYEDLCRNPDAEMRKLFKFIGLTSVDVTGAAAEDGHEPGQGHTIGGNRLRFTSKKIDIREDKAWVENLSSEELEIIDKIAGPLARELGYDK